MDSSQPCGVCGIRSTKTCGNCKSAFYCSVDHQKLFWKYHKLNCGLDHRNFTLIPLPDLQAYEAFNFIIVANNANQNQNLPRFDADLLLTNDTFDIEGPDAIARNYNSLISSNDLESRYEILRRMRLTVQETVKDADTLGLCGGNVGLVPYYHLAALDYKSSPKTTYQLPFFRETLTLFCLLETMKLQTITESVANYIIGTEKLLGYFQSCVNRLEEIVQALERNGLDEDKLYRNWLTKHSAMIGRTSLWVSAIGISFEYR